MKEGRPTKYNATMLKKAQEYLTGYDGPIPSVAGLSLFLGVSKSTVYLWAQDNKQFSDALDDIKSRQEVLLLQGGLTNVYNATIAKLIMATNHGYSDKQQTEISGKDGERINFSVEFVKPDGD